MNVEQSVELELAGETEVLGENLLQCHFGNHKSHINGLGSNPGRRGGNPATNRLNYVTAKWDNIKNFRQNTALNCKQKLTFHNFVAINKETLI
jgi:hypothetical protein